MQVAFSAMSHNKKKFTFRNIWRLAIAITGVIAIVQELQKPSEERTWHGEVAGFVPYDFRTPTMGRVRTTYWNPEGPIVSGKVFGVGWAPNLGAIVTMVGKWRANEESVAQPS